MASQWHYVVSYSVCRIASAARVRSRAKSDSVHVFMYREPYDVRHVLQLYVYRLAI